MRDLRTFGLVTILLGVLGLALSLLALGADVETDLTWREKKLERELREEVEGGDRYVDFGVLLRVVVRDDEHGEPLLDPNIKLRILREHRLGGMLDTRANPPAIVGPSPDPAVWYCSEDQEQILFHADPAVPGQLIFGSEGSGKTHVLAMLHYVWALDCIGEKRESGQTAPTKKRLKHVLEAMFALYPPQWFRYNKGEQLLTFADGSLVQFVSMKKRSEAEGSPAQGYNFTNGAGQDELQDQVEGDNDIESRGRGSKTYPPGQPDAGGDLYYKRAATCTAKESAAFRTLTAKKIASGLWVKRVMLIERSPFIPPSFLEQKRLLMTDRELRRRYYAEDLPPEHMIYFNWSRATNLRPIPVGARKITSLVIRARTNDPRHALLVGNDPGIVKAASIMLDAYELPGIADPCWWVRGELVTRHKTNEQHAVELLRVVRDRFGMNLPRRPERVHVRSHPFGQAKDKPSEDVYRIYRRVGFDIKAAQYAKKANGISTGTGNIPVEARFEMVNYLLCDAAQRRRLFVECDAAGTPVAPLLVASFESLERDELGQPPEDKTENDLTDPPDALGYALWPWEKESAAALRAQRRAG